MAEFDWDDANRGHIALHDVAPHEVEEVFSRNPITTPDEPVRGELRELAYGVTVAGRLLTIAFTIRNKQVRPITAWDMSRQERKEYAPQILGDQ